MSMRLQYPPDQLRYWMKRCGYSSDAEFIREVNQHLDASGSDLRLSAQALSNYLRRDPVNWRFRSPGLGPVTDAMVAALQLSESDELHLRRLWDGSGGPGLPLKDDAAA